MSDSMLYDVTYQVTNQATNQPGHFAIYLAGLPTRALLNDIAKNCMMNGCKASVVSVDGSIKGIVSSDGTYSLSAA